MNYTRNKEKYAEAIMQSTIMALKREMPELAMAFKIVKLKPVEFPINISTDFRRLFYNPDMVIALKENGHDFEIEFQIMHVILHGLLGDYVYTKYRRQPKAMHLALDQRVDGEVMIHQPSGGMEGQASEICIAADHIRKTKEMLNEILAANCHKDVEQIRLDTDRDYWMDANQALAYGIVDKVLA